MSPICSSAVCPNRRAPNLPAAAAAPFAVISRSRSARPKLSFWPRKCANGPTQPQPCGEAAAALAGRNPETPRVAWLRCPLLDQTDGCSVHTARPFSCHGHVSLDVEDCKISFSPDGAWSVREPALYDDLRNSWRLILQAALRLNGLSDAHYELNAALDLALQTENAEKALVGRREYLRAAKSLVAQQSSVRSSRSWR